MGDEVSVITSATAVMQGVASAEMGAERVVAVVPHDKSTRALGIPVSRTFDFEHVSIATLSGSPSSILDDLPFGVIGLSADGLVKIYNATEARLAGLPSSKVLGGNFFHNIAQCMNNFLVAQRFLDEPELDVTIDFVLTLRMRPTPVKLRLLQSKIAALHYVLLLRTT